MEIKEINHTTIKRTNIHDMVKTRINPGFCFI